MTAKRRKTREPQPQLLRLSANTKQALLSVAHHLADHMERNPDLDLADLALMQPGEAQSGGVRVALVCQARDEAIRSLREVNSESIAVGGPRERPIVFVFPGLGNQYRGMASQLYNTEPVFEREIDECCAILERKIGGDVRESLLCAEPSMKNPPAAASNASDFAAMVGRRAQSIGDSLQPTELAQPAMFVFEYCLARLWMHWGLRPAAMIGYSIGEYVAACIAGVFSRDAALQIVSERAIKIAGLPRGAMLAVAASEKDLRSWGLDGVWLSAVHGPRMCILGGTITAVEHIEAQLAEKEIVSRRVLTTHAFHTELMAPVHGEIEKFISRQQRRLPSIPFISNATGTWITGAQVVDPAYWAAHMCECVRFGSGVRELGRAGFRIFLEAGPGSTMCGLISAQLTEDKVSGGILAQTIPSSYQPSGARTTMLQAASRLWCNGVELDWKRVQRRRRRRAAMFPLDLPQVEKRFPGTAMRHDNGLTNTQQALVEIWKGKLQCEIQSVQTEFFDIGGDSLIALQMLHAVQAKFGVKVALREFLSAPALASLAKQIDDKLSLPSDRVS